MKQKRQADQLILNKGKKAIKKSKDNLLIIYFHIQQEENFNL